MNTDRTDTQQLDFKNIEKKWQAYWNQSELFKAPDIAGHDSKFYMLVMFIYPSGDIHMGHFRNYIIGDAVARYQMMLGKSVIHPFGWDAFGLPAERAAIQRNIHPEKWTLDNVAVSRDTLQKVGISFDWSREVTSCLPDYYRWTQWMFIQLFKKGLAYRKEGYVNWDPVDKTVLANEQVINGFAERSGAKVEKKKLMGWYFKITDYADRLIDDLDKLPDWPQNVKTIQKEWIGRSYGFQADFRIEKSGEPLPVFTTRPDTIYGVTFIAISPESEIVDRLEIEPDRMSEVDVYRRKAAARTEIDRAAATTEKDGVFTGRYAINPFNGERVQLWVADYVLAGYGTGAVMGVPAHDSRDFAFAKKYQVPIRVVIHPDKQTVLDPDKMDDAYVEYGPMVNSGPFDGLSGREAIDAVNEYGEKTGFGRRQVQYRLRDWSISRQRYWGCPIPIIHCPQCGEVAVEETELPIQLPSVEDYHPKGRSPLADVPEFMNVNCPKCGGEAERDPDTMDTFVCSSWYFLRYLDPLNDRVPYDKSKAASWMPIDLYVGGITHATGHLIYFRFFTKFLHDLGWLSCEEPATKLFNHGMVMDANGEVMSKSKGNVVSPIHLMEQHGVDITRLAMFFTAPSDKEVLWQEGYITGVEKFVGKRLFPLAANMRHQGPDLKQYFNATSLSPVDRDAYVKLNQTIKRVTESIDRLQFNTAIAALMELLGGIELGEITEDTLHDQIIAKSIQLVAPMAPHLAEEMWESAGFTESVFKSSWPVPDSGAMVGDLVEIAIQINGKLRDTISVEQGAAEQIIEDAALASKRIQAYTNGHRIVRKIHVKGRLLNIVVQS